MSFSEGLLGGRLWGVMIGYHASTETRAPQQALQQLVLLFVHQGWSMIYCHTMAKAKVAVTIDARILGDLDALIAADRFPNRSQAVEAALADKINRLKHTRLAREAAKLDVRQEQAEADEGLAMDAAAWPKY